LGGGGGWGGGGGGGGGRGGGGGGGGGEIFHTRLDRLWGQPSFLYSGYRVSLGGKAVGAWR